MAASIADVTQDLISATQQQLAINTHCHQLPQQAFQLFDLETLLKNSYVNWIGDGLEKVTPATRSNFLDKIRFHAAFVWLEKSLQELYGVSEPINERTWLAWSMRIAQAHRDPDFRLQVLTERCRYQRLVLDAYWQPGSDNEEPKLFTPAFRVNAFFFGFSPRTADHDGHNPYQLYPHPFLTDLDEYLNWVEDLIRQKKEAGCVALKLPIAYDRGLDFIPVTLDQARSAFARLTTAERKYAIPKSFSASSLSNAPSSSQVSPEVFGLDIEDVNCFQNFLLFHLCEIAAELNLPLQIHTGTGQGQRTQAGWLRPVIERNPATHFVLLHSSYPWIAEIPPLVQRFPNVYPDLSMLPLFSSNSARWLLHELIESAPADRLTWGCDTWTPEESYGARLALQQVLAKVLCEKIKDGYFGYSEALQVIQNIFYKNPARLYFKEVTA